MSDKPVPLEHEISADKYWSRPPARDQGDAHDVLLFCQVGSALSAWEGVEEALARLFMLLIECTSATTAHAVLRAFGAIEFNSGRRKAIEAAAEVYFGIYWPVAKKDFDKLMRHIDAASRRRDDIAHGRVIGFTFDGKDAGSFLTPPTYNTGRTEAFIKDSAKDKFAITRAKYRYTSEDVVEFVRKFTRLRNDVHAYVRSIAKEEGAFSPTLTEKFSKTRAAEKPRKSSP